MLVGIPYAQSNPYAKGRMDLMRITFYFDQGTRRPSKCFPWAWFPWRSRHFTGHRIERCRWDDRQERAPPRANKCCSPAFNPYGVSTPGFGNGSQPAQSVGSFTESQCLVLILGPISKISHSSSFRWAQINARYCVPWSGRFAWWFSRIPSGYRAASY